MIYLAEALNPVSTLSLFFFAKESRLELLLDMY